MGPFIHIRSSRFSMLPEERGALVTEGTYGKAVAEYLQAGLSSLGYAAPFVCCEDWGWWVELKTAPFVFGVCVYCGPCEEVPRDFVCTDGAPGRRIWNWKRFRYINTEPWVTQLHQDLLTILQRDAEIEIVSRTDEFPF